MYQLNLTLSDVSVVITTRNEEKNIGKCLSSIPRQCEIIVVDNYSTDRTKILCTNPIYNQLKEVTFIEQDGERSKQRNAGVLASTKPYILFLDADMSLERGVIEECLRSKYRVLYIPEVIVGNKVRNYERQFYTSTVIDCPRFFHRDCFLPFDTNMAPGYEDADLNLRMRERYDIGTTRRTIAHNEAELTLLAYLNKKARYTPAGHRFALKWKGYPTTCLTPYYRLVKVFTEHGKWKEVISHPILFLRMYWLITLKGLIWWWSN